MKSLGAKAQGARLERMRASTQWHEVEGDSGRVGGFRNHHPVIAGLRDPTAERPSLSDFVCHAARRVPGGPLPLVNPRLSWLTAPSSGLRTTWLGHSTVLVEIDGARLLTDPVWGPRASPTRLAGPKRFHSMPVALRELPPLHAVVLSHDHYDHLDYPTVRELARWPLPFITSLGVGAHLEAFGVAPERITELDWWQSCRVPGTEVEVTAVPAQHFSGRSLNDRNATLWSSMVMTGPRHRVFFSGDTGLTTQYQEIAARLGPFDVVMLEVGAFHPSWGDIHLGPHNALQAAQWLGAGAARNKARLLPIHWSTFSLALHDWDQPAEVLLAEAPARGVPLLMPRLGEAVQPAEAQGPPTPWWREVRAPRGGRPQVAPPAATTAASRRVFTWPSD